MNIGFVTHDFYAADGTGGYAVELVNRLARNHDVTLYAASIRSPVAEGVTVIRVPAVGASAYTRILTFPAGFASVRRKHDVVHAQGWVTRYADVVTTHIVLAAWRDAARRAGVRSRPGERWLGGYVTARERDLFRRARVVIAPSKRAATDVARFYGRTRDVFVVHHGFPPARNLPPRRSARLGLGLPPDAFVALYAGDARKGLDRAISAVSRAPGVHLLVVSRSESTTYLENAKSLGVSDRVHWAGGLDDILPAYSAADVLLHPTIYDTFAMVVAEAMAYGVPVILTRDAGIADLVTDRASGWIAGSDISDIVAGLLILKEDRSLRERVALAGQKVASGRTWDDVVSETVAVYRKDVR
ncbi:MAG: glycosyltransferase family 4 protein [Gemmatimonadales bacterium]